MADNVAITPGTGATVAADDIDGVLYQRVKIAVGADGSATDLAPGGTTSANSLPVTVATDDPLQEKLGIVTETAPANDTASSGLNGRLQRIAQNLTTFFGAKVTAIAALAAGGSGVIGWLSQIWNELATNGIKLLSQGYDVAVSTARPANTTAYTAGDVVLGALTFAIAGPNAGAIMICGVQLELDISAVPSGMTGFRLYLYSVTPPSAVGDNGAWDLVSGDRASFLGFIDLGAPGDLGSTCYVEANNVNKQIKLASTSLYGYLVTIGGYTPAANSEVYVVTLHTVAV